MTHAPTIVCNGDGWLVFDSPLETRVAYSPDEVLPVLEWAEASAASNWVVGFVSYEAAPAFDPALTVVSSGVPLAQFSVFSAPERLEKLPPPELKPWGVQVTPLLDEESYRNQVEQVLGMIGDGRVYQINLTHPYKGDFWGEPVNLFYALADPSSAPYAAFLPGESFSVASLSPELFFERDGDLVRSKPMKGTRPAGTDSTELSEHPKDQAENLMIVDMIRNDLGRIARVGSAKTPRLFEVQEHGTVLQMTSTVEADIGDLPTLEIFRALFPCASVVGAPKVEATRAISELEPSGRGIYCGAIGFMAPGRRARFNVAIRTLVLGKEAVYPVGSGIVWDSNPADEWQECQIKTRLLSPVQSGWQSLETMLWTPAAGFAFLNEHLHRLATSLSEIGLSTDLESVNQALKDAVQGQTEALRVRLLISQFGEVTIEIKPLGDWPETLRAAIARPILSTDPWLRHKTTHRRIYDHARREHPDCDDVLLVNERGELCEFTLGNLVIERDGELLTPPRSASLLPGVQREVDLHSGKIREGTLFLRDLERAKSIWHINSVRGWTRVKIERGMVVDTGLEPVTPTVSL